MLRLQLATLASLLIVLGTLLAVAAGVDKARTSGKQNEPSEDLRAELKTYRHQIVHESNRDGNWELYLVHADGTHAVNLTRTPDVDELYPKPSPDGSHICF